MIARRLRSTRILAAYVLAVTLGAACYDVVEPVSRASVTTIDAPAQGVADGASLLRIDARVAGTVPKDQRSVSFTTTAGKFANGSSTVSVQADTAGLASTLLQAPSDTVIAVVTASAGGGALSTLIRFVAPPPAIKSLQSPDTLLADGATLTEIVATLDPTVRTAQRSVSFSTTAGTWVGATGTSVQVNADASGRASALLKAPLEATRGIITATSGTSTVSKGIQFTADVPTSIQVTPTSFALKAGAAYETMITALVRRSTGSGLSGVQVDFRATDTTSKDLGVLTTPASTDANGSVAVRYTAGETQYRGRVLISATVKGTSISDRTAIVIINP
jgi:hypothetical protein